MFLPSAFYSNESSPHLFFECDYSQQVWRGLTERFGRGNSFRFEEVVTLITNSQINDRMGIVFILLFQAAIYHLWKERNSRLHSGISRPFQVIIRDISLQLRAKLYSLDKEDTTIITRHHHPSYLSLWFGRVQA
ncbi:hypothetical protein Bca52824_009746 [Brassica carinata]|uniref:Reverse transcriptase zinc-binding domain-containing protein n=1 Tax=Brassica carinata TaxID=52824 RepID=A0A8X7WAC2_BRACI|nr:hypothetical protein Bca52824_009746 [Brassica carinata]